MISEEVKKFKSCLDERYYKYNVIWNMPFESIDIRSRNQENIVYLMGEDANKIENFYHIIIL